MIVRRHIHKYRLTRFIIVLKKCIMSIKIMKQKFVKVTYIFANRGYNVIHKIVEVDGFTSWVFYKSCYSVL